MEIKVSQPEITQRVKDNLPTVLLTLLSIVQALALEFMWVHITASNHLFVWSFSSLLEWMQIVATLLGILLVWLIYSTMVMRFRWIPTTWDLAFPFFVGVMEFWLVETLGAGTLGLWFLIMGLIFAAMAWSSQVTFRRARRDAENAAFFARTPPASYRDYLLAGANTIVLLGFGVVMLWLQPLHWIVFAGLLWANFAIIFQVRLTDMFWRRSVMPDTL